jgi:hypothetical protein
MDDGRIEKATRRARLVLSDGRDIRGEVFVGLYDPHHVGPQRVGELLNEASAFMPVRTGKSVLMVNRAHIVAVTLPADRERDELAMLGKRYTVRVKTTRGEFRGAVFVNLPEVSTRVTDYFNQPVHFLPLFQARTIVYLNRDFIVHVQD